MNKMFVIGMARAHNIDLYGADSFLREKYDARLANQ
jgi:hypothetical protein